MVLVLLGLTLAGLGVRLMREHHAAATPDYSIVVDTLAGAMAPDPEDAAAAKLAAGIDPNTAPAEDLELLPGIGPALAARIVLERRNHGPFADVADLARVRGVGPTLLARLEPLLRFP